MFKLFSKRPKANPPEPDRGDIKLIFGLGNPGEKYALTYHNAGALYIDHFAEGPFKKYKSFEFFKENELIFARSLLFMNQSGRAVREALKYFNLKPENLLVAHDDSDILLGEYKFSFDQGSAGHNGVTSIFNHLKTQRFFRLRIGVRENQEKAGEFVLKSIPKEKLSLLREMFSRIEIL